MTWIEAANAEGAQLVPQVLASPLNAMMTLAAGTRSNGCLRFAEIAAATTSTAELAARLAEPGVRDRILSEGHDLLAARAWLFDTLYQMRNPPDYEPLPERSIGADARRRGLVPMDCSTT